MYHDPLGGSGTDCRVSYDGHPCPSQIPTDKDVRPTKRGKRYHTCVGVVFYSSTATSISGWVVVEIRQNSTTRKSSSEGLPERILRGVLDTAVFWTRIVQPLLNEEAGTNPR